MFFNLASGDQLMQLGYQICSLASLGNLVIPSLNWFDAVGLFFNNNLSDHLKHCIVHRFFFFVVYAAPIAEAVLPVSIF